MDRRSGMAHSTLARDTVQALAGPGLLILTGWLFLEDYSDGYEISKTWPLLLIWLGLCKVMEHLLSPPAGRTSG